MRPCSSSPKVERKVVERERRMNMNKLCSKLSSLLPNFNPQEMMSHNDQLHEATDYIKELQEKIEKLKERKEILMRNNGAVVEVQALGTCLEVILISDLNQQFMFHQVIAVIEEEGAEVVSANFSTVGDKVLHTIHSEVRDSTMCFKSMRISQRLRKLVQQNIGNGIPY